MKKFAISLLILSSLCFAADEVKQDNKVTVREEPKNVKINNLKGDVIGEMGEKTLLENPKIQGLLQDAYSKGYKDGIRDAEHNMIGKIDKMSKYLDQLFDFHRLVLEGKYVPPLIAVIKTPVEVSEDGKSMSVESRRYEVIEPGYFVDEIPTWRNFITGGK